MEDLCAKDANDDIDLQEKIRRFLGDKSIDTVTGIRRMGKDNLVDFTAKMCIDLGIECTIFPDISSSNVIIFRYWMGIESDVQAILLNNPSIDILYGQDLCHQVPAIVRYNVKK